MNGADINTTDHYRFLSNKHWLADPIQAIFMSGPRRAVHRVIMKQRPHKLLDVCCGTGSLASRFTWQGVETIGVDSSRTMLDRAKQKGRLSDTLLMDVSEIEYENEFDAAYISMALHEMDAGLRERLWTRLNEAVIPGGIIAVMDLNSPAKNTRSARFWQRFFDLDERNFLHINPEHYYNYQEFIRQGGIQSWMHQRVASFHTEQYFFAGNIAVLSVIK